MRALPWELIGLDAAQVVARLGLLPHPEGGYYRETYRSRITTPTPTGTRTLCTAILYLLTADDPSRFHRLRFDEVWFFHLGSPLELVLLGPSETLIVGADTPQALVPGGRWVAAHLVGDGRGAGVDAAGCEAAGRDSASGYDWALAGCVVSPGFEFDDFETAERNVLLAAYPEAAHYLRGLS